jgi:hypothetical protein
MSFILNVGDQTERLDSEAHTAAVLAEMRSRSPGRMTALFDKLFRRHPGESAAPPHDLLALDIFKMCTALCEALAETLRARGHDGDSLDRARVYLNRTIAMRNPQEASNAFREAMFALGNELEWRGFYPCDSLRSAGIQQTNSWRLKIAAFNGPGDATAALGEMAQSIDRLSAASGNVADDGAALAAVSPSAQATAAEPEHILRRKPRQKRI